MQKLVIRYGLIASAITAIFMGVTSILIANFEGSAINWIWGFAGMLITFSTIAMALRQYKLDNPELPLTYWKALQIGLLITLMASIAYVICWKIYMTIFFPDFMEKYSQQMIDKLNNGGAPADVIAKQTKGFMEMRENYKNPLYFAFYTFVEIFPVGLLVSLILPIFYRTKKAEPAEV